MSQFVNPPVPAEVQITGFTFDRVQRVASFSAMISSQRGNFNLSVSLPSDVDPKDKDPAKTALKAAIKEQADLLIKALDELA